MSNKLPSLPPFADYLLAKRPVDDRALNLRLWQSLLSYIDERAGARSRCEPKHTAPRNSRPARPLTILELGCGIGTMLERILGASMPQQLVYIALDSDAANLQAMAAWLPGRLHSLGYTRIDQQELPPLGASDAASFGTLAFTHTEGNTLILSLVHADVQGSSTAFEERIHATGVVAADVVIAHAFLDLVQCRPLLSRLHSLMAQDSRLYATINFDGLTVFEPTIDPQLDAQIESLYHASMDNRRIEGRAAGHSRTGRKLFHDLRASGYQVLDAGSSDWMVFPGINGYTKEGAAFLHHILDFVEGTLTGHPHLDAQAFARWIVTRRGQVAQGELVYIAHQVDYLAQPISDASAPTRIE